MPLLRHLQSISTQRRTRSTALRPERAAGLPPQLRLRWGLTRRFMARISNPWWTASPASNTIAYPLYDDVATLIARSGATLTNTFSTTATADGLMLTSGDEPWSYPLMSNFTPPSARVHRTEDIWKPGLMSHFGHPEPAYIEPVLHSAAAIVARGGRIAIGSHGNIPGVGFHYELEYHALGGMPPYQILRAATIDGARAIGHARDFGSLEVEKTSGPADS